MFKSTKNKSTVYEVINPAAKIRQNWII